MAVKMLIKAKVSNGYLWHFARVKDNQAVWDRAHGDVMMTREETLLGKVYQLWL